MLFKGKDPKPKIFLDVWFLCCLGSTTLAWGLPAREAGKDQLDSLRGTREAPERQERTIWTAREAPGRQERIKWTAWKHQGGRKGSIGHLARRQGGTREAGKSHLESLGGTRETFSAGLPIESRLWKGAGFCLTFNTISMANGPVRGKSWGGRHGRLPRQTEFL